jgi:MOSC domain-containing protein YiiM
VAGTIESIHLIAGMNAPIVRVESVQVHAGRGLEGDRHTPPPGETHEDGEFALTLIEAETIEAVRDEHGIDLSDGRSRRQVTTRGIGLNELVGKEFSLGQIRCRGVELCEPCKHLERITAQGVIKALVHRGGIMADVLEGGVIAVGDDVVADPLAG